jgi:hypothetical protein
MPGFFEDLVNRATGLKAGLLSERQSRLFRDGASRN